MAKLADEADQLKKAGEELPPKHEEETKREPWQSMRGSK